MPESFASIPNVLTTEISGRQCAITVSGFSEETLSAAKALKPNDVTVDDLSLEDIFVAMVGSSEAV